MLQFTTSHVHQFMFLGTKNKFSLVYFIFGYLGLWNFPGSLLLLLVLFVYIIAVGLWGCACEF